jgi:hypothetical protein
MDVIISCCGVVCSDCEYYPNACKGCPESKGNVFWLQYTDEEICPIYQCCIDQKQYSHCGKCPNVPCRLYERGDPTKTDEENKRTLEKQLTQLKQM